MTDAFPSYISKDVKYEHHQVNHGTGKCVKGIAHTNFIASLWSLLKCCNLDIHYYTRVRHPRVRHPHRCANEFAGRHIIRQTDTGE